MKTLIGLALVANMYGADFVVGNKYHCGLKDKKPFIELATVSENMVMVGDTMMFSQKDNPRLHIGMSQSDEQMMIFLHEDGELTIGGERLRSATLECKIEVKPKK